MAVWRLDSKTQTLLLGAIAEEMPSVLYWGPALSKTDDVQAYLGLAKIGITGGMLDDLPALSLCPQRRDGFSAHLGLRGRDTEGRLLNPKFSTKDVEETPSSLIVCCADPDLGLTYQASFHVKEQSGVIAARSRLTAAQPITVDWLSTPVLPASQAADHMVDYAGRWCREFQEQAIPWRAGQYVRDNQTGRTGHEYFPALLVPDIGATQSHGMVQAVHYGWSGGHKVVAEELPDGRRQIQFGHASYSSQEAATDFETAPLYLAVSEQGYNGIAIQYQDFVRQELITAPTPERPRPVHYNCWESVYFDHDLAELKDIAERAHSLGAERFVLDDGWFGHRDDDTSSLGDWTVDPRKYPEGLQPLIDHIHGLGMTFGIWFEPEMINERSDLFEAHPEWVLGDLDQPRGRQQLVLNMALPAVQDYLYQAIAAILSTYPVDYIKWDHNRILPLSDAAQTQGTYALLDRLRANFPLVEIESCASGGGRIDYGILERTHRVWLSDSNDALERTRIQYHSSLFLPAMMTGSHVGPRDCHTSGRRLDMTFRAWIAAQRHMGFEMDPRELSDEEAESLRTVCAWWKDNRDWLMKAHILRLDHQDPSLYAELHRSMDQKDFVVFANYTDTNGQISPRPLRLTGLNPDKRYRLKLVNKQELVPLSMGETALAMQDHIEASGRYLMTQGLNLPWRFPCGAWVIQGEEITDEDKK